MTIEEVKNKDIRNILNKLKSIYGWNIVIEPCYTDEKISYNISGNKIVRNTRLELHFDVTANGYDSFNQAIDDFISSEKEKIQNNIIEYIKPEIEYAINRKSLADIDEIKTYVLAELRDLEIPFIEQETQHNKELKNWLNKTIHS